MVEATEVARTKIREFIKHNEISENSMAQTLGITKTYLNYILSGQRTGPSAILWITKIIELYKID